MTGAKRKVPMVVRHVAVSLVCAVAVMVLTVVAGWSPSVGYLLALAVVAAVATAALRRLGDSTTEALWPLPFPPEPAPTGVDPQLSPLAALLRRGAEDPAVFRNRLQPLLAELAAHRLHRGYGVYLVTEAEAAQQLLGDDVWRLLTELADGPVRPAAIEQAVTAIERL